MRKLVPTKRQKMPSPYCSRIKFRKQRLQKEVIRWFWGTVPRSSTVRRRLTLIIGKVARKADSQTMARNC